MLIEQILEESLFMLAQQKNELQNWQNKYNRLRIRMQRIYNERNLRYPFYDFGDIDEEPITYPKFGTWLFFENGRK